MKKIVNYVSLGKPMEIIHTDICGPMPIESMGGSHYILMFTDDYSRYTIVYFLKSKDETLSKFKEYVYLVENQTGYGKGSEVTMEEDIPPSDLPQIVQRKELFISLLIPIVLNKTESLRD